MNAEPKQTEHILNVEFDGKPTRLRVGEGLQLLLDTSGTLWLRPYKQPTATVVGLKAERQEDGSYALPQAIAGATPREITGLAVYRAGLRLTHLDHYTIESDSRGVRILLRPHPSYFFRPDELIVDFVANY